MNAIELEGAQEKADAEALIVATPMVEGVESIRVELGEDHTNQASMWLIFRLAPGFEPDDAWYGEFSKYSTDLGLKVLQSGITRFPYARLESAA